MVKKNKHMKVAIVKYNAGNVCSVDYALQSLGVEPIITDDKDLLLSADKVIFPGVGHADAAMRNLQENNLTEIIKNLKQPVLGICLGMQLMCSYTEEGNVDCLDIFPAKVRKFEPKLKVPHMGWNKIQNLKSPLFKDIDEDYVYFVHSYYVEQNDYSIADCDYILDYSAAINKDNFYAVQFHPEKSSDTGRKILENFLKC